MIDDKDNLKVINFSLAKFLSRRINRRVSDFLTSFGYNNSTVPP